MTEFDNRIPYAKPRPTDPGADPLDELAVLLKWALLALAVLGALLVAHAAYGQIDAFVDMQRAME